MEEEKRIDQASLDKLIEHMRFPVWYDRGSQFIFDADNRMVCDIRGWGWIQKLGTEEEAGAMQDALGNKIAQMINRMPEKPKETVDCAAIQLPDGEILKGRMHGSIKSNYIVQGGAVKITDDMEGFLTNTGRFVSRKDAGEIAFKAGQTEKLELQLMSYHLMNKQV